MLASIERRSAGAEGSSRSMRRFFGAARRGGRTWGENWWGDRGLPLAPGPRLKQRRIRW